MRQYQVPQFIDIEDKIIGPLTIKQFIYLASGGGAIVASFYLLPFILFIAAAVPIAALSLGLAFLKINGIPFPKVLASMIGYLMKPHLYLWKQLPPEVKKAASGPADKPETIMKVPKLTESKLQDLSWSLDIKGKLNQADEE